MKIQEKPHAGGLDALGHRFGVRQVAVWLIIHSRVAVVGMRIDEDAQADVVEAVVFEDGEDIFLFAVVEVSGARGFVLRDPGDVGADDERAGAGGEGWRSEGEDE